MELFVARPRGPGLRLFPLPNFCRFSRTPPRSPTPLQPRFDQFEDLTTMYSEKNSLRTISVLPDGYLK